MQSSVKNVPTAANRTEDYSLKSARLAEKFQAHFFTFDFPSIGASLSWGFEAERRPQLAATFSAAQHACMYIWYRDTMCPLCWTVLIFPFSWACFRNKLNLFRFIFRTTTRRCKGLHLLGFSKPFWTDRKLMTWKEPCWKTSTKIFVEVWVIYLLSVIVEYVFRFTIESSGKYLSTYLALVCSASMRVVEALTKGLRFVLVWNLIK